MTGPGINLPVLFPRLLVGLALVAAPLALYQPTWLSLGWLSIALFRYWQVRHRRPMLGSWLRVPLALLGLGAVIAGYGTVAGRDPGVALLTTMISLKLLETAAARDFYLLTFLGFFLVIANFLYSQSIPMILYLLATVLALTASLVALQRVDPTASLRADLRLAGTLVLQSLPIMAVLFVLFPRVDEPLWRMPDRSHRATTGISDEMAPGSISELVQSEDVAFRVDFDSAIPPPAQRYWRGPVLWFTDGRRWRAGTPPADPGLRYTPLGNATRYAVTIEPSYRRWVFGLDLPAEVSGGIEISSDYQLLARQPVQERRRYRAVSYVDYRTSSPSAAELRSALQRPGRGAGRVRDLALAWRAASSDDDEVVRRALDYFRQQPFVYTLNPPLLGNDPVDGFLFETRRGFCEHYAAAFTLLMRHAGIPARVVTGYQGGQLNPVGNYLIVRQSDAHAWSEVWLPQRGWVRVDPTAAVAPDRVERAIDTGASSAIEGAILFRGQGTTLRQWVEQLQLTLDAVNAAWDRWILGYGLEQQLALLAGLGVEFPSWTELTVAMAVLGGVLLVLVGWSVIRRPRPPDDPAARLYARFCGKLARCGLARRPDEGPRGYAQRVAAARPELAAACQRIAALYIAQRYGRAPVRQVLPELRRRVATFRP